MTNQIFSESVLNILLILGTGKTHTMEGNIHSEEHAGIVPRSVKAILEQLEASDSEYTIRVSFLELCKSNFRLLELLGTENIILQRKEHFLHIIIYLKYLIFHD